MPALIKTTGASRPGISGLIIWPAFLCFSSSSLSLWSVNLTLTFCRPEVTGGGWGGNQITIKPGGSYHAISVVRPGPFYCQPGTFLPTGWDWYHYKSILHWLWEWVEEGRRRGPRKYCQGSCLCLAGPVVTRADLDIKQQLFWLRDLSVVGQLRLSFNVSGGDTRKQGSIRNWETIFVYLNLIKIRWISPLSCQTLFVQVSS